jgi:hypothetical protein
LPEIFFLRLHFTFYFLIETRSPPGLLAPTLVALPSMSTGPVSSIQPS